MEPDPDPKPLSYESESGKSYESFRIRIHNTGFYNSNLCVSFCVVNVTHLLIRDTMKCLESNLEKILQPAAFEQQHAAAPAALASDEAAVEESCRSAVDDNCRPAVEAAPPLVGEPSHRTTLGKFCYMILSTILVQDSKQNCVSGNI
jgi:hypothetical protein